MRLFSAFHIPESLHQAVLRLQAGLPGAHWRPEENFHVTLQFYGDVEPVAIHDLGLALQEIIVPQVELVITGLGHFGGKKPFAVWAGITGASRQDDQQLYQLADDCRQAAKRAGIDAPTRKYMPHLTLAYCKGTTATEVARYFEEFDGYEALRFQTDQFHLFSSHLGKGPARYQVESSFGAT
ncbi:MAG: RNA 2',3'-cyclic phosphodiesterase [Robiginitomaculum sp.]|nr:MAG: RNA 2',3'-cyclic phosphodiesterase [Robiginitomaculum sp.]